MAKYVKILNPTVLLNKVDFLSAMTEIDPELWYEKLPETISDEVWDDIPLILVFPFKTEDGRVREAVTKFMPMLLDGLLQKRLPWFRRSWELTGIDSGFYRQLQQDGSPCGLSRQGCEMLPKDANWFFFMKFEGKGCKDE